MRSIKGQILSLILCTLIPCIAHAQGTKQGTMVGNWKLNVAKSDFGDGPKLQSMLVNVTSDAPDSIVFSVTETAESGMTFTYKYKGAADGKDYPADGTSTTYAYTEEGGVVAETQKDTDGTITKGTFTLSPNGKVGTWIYTITDPQGGVIHTKLVYDRVQ
ncbi:MAG TPA: hypothetical protein VM554_07715 [Acidisarcina sp.]|nr:hypothetical protein [Acidisarcina sp.]